MNANAPNYTPPPLTRDERDFSSDVPKIASLARKLIEVIDAAQSADMQSQRGKTFVRELVDGLNATRHDSCIESLLKDALGASAARELGGEK